MRQQAPGPLAGLLVSGAWLTALAAGVHLDQIKKAVRRSVARAAPTVARKHACASSGAGTAERERRACSALEIDPSPHVLVSLQHLQIRVVEREGRQLKYRYEQEQRRCTQKSGGAGHPAPTLPPHVSRAAKPGASHSTSACLEALPVHNGGARLVVLALGDPHLRGQGGWGGRSALRLGIPGLICSPAARIEDLPTCRAQQNGPAPCPQRGPKRTYTLCAHPATPP